jgi:hypothetical protein
MLTSDFKEFAELLNSSGVEYLVVGGYALAAYGHPRYTGDLDFWIGSNEGNADRVLAALSQFGFGGLGITKEDLAKPDQVIQLGYPPGRIDLLTSIDGVSFADCYPRRMTVMVDGVALDFISLEDFKINKKAVGRHRDLADLDALAALPPPPPAPQKASFPGAPRRPPRGGGSKS